MAEQSQTARESQSKSTGHDLAGKYLTFKLDGQKYGFEILRVREIIRLVDVTPVPKTPPSIRGIVNLRGKIIPVMDLRVKFGMETAEDTEMSCIIVVDLGDVETGVVVDSVAQVVSFDHSDIEPPPTIGSAVDTDHVMGVGKSGDEVSLLLDIMQIMDQKIMSSVVEGAGGRTAQAQN